MEYLPSNKFAKRAGIILLLFGAWFVFSENGTADKNIAIDKEVDAIEKIEKRGNVLVFSRENTSLSKENDQETTNKWHWIEEEEEETTKKSEPTYTRQTSDNTASISNSVTKKGFISYKFSNLNIVYDKNDAVYKKYAKDLVTALKPYSLTNLPNEGYLVMQAIQTGNSQDFEKIRIMSELHKVVAETLLGMQVPNEISSQHLKLVNNCAKISYIDLLLSLALESPDTVIATVNDFKRETDELVLNINQINKFFSEKKIEFGPEEQINLYINLIK